MIVEKVVRNSVFFDPAGHPKVAFAVGRIDANDLHAARQFRIQSGLAGLVARDLQGAGQFFAWDKGYLAQAVKPVAAEITGYRLDRFGKRSTPEADAPMDLQAAPSTPFPDAGSGWLSGGSGRSLWRGFYRFCRHGWSTMASKAFCLPPQIAPQNPKQPLYQ